MALFTLDITLLDLHGEPFPSLPPLPARFGLFGTARGNQIRNVDAVEWQAIGYGVVRYARMDGGHAEWFAVDLGRVHTFTNGERLSFESGSLVVKLTPEPLPLSFGPLGLLIPTRQLPLPRPRKMLERIRRGA